MLGHLKAGDEHEMGRPSESKQELEDHRRTLKEIVSALTILGFLKESKDEKLDYNPNAVIPGQVPQTRKS